MDDKIKEAITNLANKLIKYSTPPDDALKYSQSILNLAHAIVILNEVGKRG